MTWISTQDQWPPIDTPVLAVVKGEVRTAITHMEHPTFEDVYQSFAYWTDPHNDNDIWDDPSDITHWMPQPALPAPAIE